MREESRCDASICKSFGELVLKWPMPRNINFLVSIWTMGFMPVQLEPYKGVIRGLGEKFKEFFKGRSSGMFDLFSFVLISGYFLK